MTEAQLQHAVRLALGREPDLVIWRNETGVAEHLDRRGRKGHVRYGLCRGSSDLIGILKPSGRFFALELKTAIGKVTDEQDLFLRLIRRMGGFACVVRSVEEARDALTRAREGLCE